VELALLTWRGSIPNSGKLTKEMVTQRMRVPPIGENFGRTLRKRSVVAVNEYLPRIRDKISIDRSSRVECLPFIDNLSFG